MELFIFNIYIYIYIYSSIITKFTTSSYKKPTNIKPYTFNFHCECPLCYKRTIIKTFISIAKLISSSQTIFLNELKDIKQTLIKNGSPNYIFDKEIKHFIDKMEQYNIDNNLNHKQPINLTKTNFITIR